MSIALVKTLCVGGLGCSAVVTPLTTASLKLFDNNASGGGTWSRAVYVISKSTSKNVQLFVEEKLKSEREGNTDTTKEYLIKALYKGKPVQGTLLLCSPKQDKDSYYLLLSTDTYLHSWKNLEGEGKSCRDVRDEKNLGEKLSIKADPIQTSGSERLPKAILLKDCVIKDLRQENNWVTGRNKSLIEITCTEQYGTQKVKIVDQGFEELKI